MILTVTTVPSNWFTDADATQRAVEAITRDTIGVAECPVGDLPTEKVMEA